MKNNFKFWQTHTQRLHTHALQSAERCEIICQWILANGKRPNDQSDDPVEKSHGQWLKRKAESKRGSGHRTFYEVDQKVADSHNLGHIFGRSKSEIVAARRVELAVDLEEILDFVEEWGFPPRTSQQSSIARATDNEFKLGYKLKVLRAQRNPEDVKRAKARELGWLFAANLQKATNIYSGLMRVEVIAEHYHEYGDYPSQIAKPRRKGKKEHERTKEERKLGLWLNNQRMAKAGKLDGKPYAHRFHLEFQKRAVALGVPRMFNQIKPRAS